MDVMLNFYWYLFNLIRLECYGFRIGADQLRRVLATDHV